jgi:hypothetical protein
MPHFYNWPYYVTNTCDVCPVTPNGIFAKVCVAGIKLFLKSTHPQSHSLTATRATRGNKILSGRMSRNRLSELSNPYTSSDAQAYQPSGGYDLERNNLVAGERYEMQDQSGRILTIHEYLDEVPS